MKTLHNGSLTFLIKTGILMDLAEKLKDKTVVT